MTIGISLSWFFWSPWGSLNCGWQTLLPCLSKKLECCFSASKSFKGNEAWDLWTRKHRLICMHFPPPLLLICVVLHFPANSEILSWFVNICTVPISITNTLQVGREEKHCPSELSIKWLEMWCSHFHLLPILEEHHGFSVATVNDKFRKMGSKLKAYNWKEQVENYFLGFHL